MEKWNNDKTFSSITSFSACKETRTAIGRSKENPILQRDRMTKYGKIWMRKRKQQYKQYQKMI